MRCRLEPFVLAREGMGAGRVHLAENFGTRQIAGWLRQCVDDGEERRVVRILIANRCPSRISALCVKRGGRPAHHVQERSMLTLIPSRPGSAARRRAFTLIELLVVITI